MTKFLSPDQVRQMLNQSMRLSFSPVVVQLIHTILEQDSDIRQISRILGLDPVLSAAIIRLVNTPYFGTLSPVESLEQAARLLGTREILKLALSVSIKKGLSQGRPLPQDKFYQAWRTIVWGAIVGEKLSAISKAASPEAAYLALLLKDVSLFFLYGYEDDAVWACPSEYDFKQNEAETDRWGYTHAEITKMLAQSWNLPPNIIEAIAGHHQDIASLKKGPSLTLIAAVATRWSELMHSPAPNLEKLIHLEILISDAFSLSPGIIQAIREESIQDFKSMLHLLEIPESSLDERLYELPMETIKTFYFLSLELANNGHNLHNIANIIGRHLDLYWQVDAWRLYLQTPKRNDYMLFSQNPEDNGNIRQEGPFAAEISRQRGGQIRFALSKGGVTLGEMHLPEPFLQHNNELNFRNYLRMITQALHNYYHDQAGVSLQADIFQNLPVGVAKLDAAGQMLEANEILYKLMGLDPQEKNILLLDLLGAKSSSLVRDNWQKITAPDGPQHISTIISLPKAPNAPPDADECRKVFLSLYRGWEDAYKNDVLIVIEDLTELSVLEAQTLQQRDFMDNLFRVMQEIVMTIDEEGRITWAAPPTQHLIDKNFFDLCRPTPITHTWGPHILTDKDVLAHPVEVGIKISEQRLGLFEFVFAPLKAENSYLLVGRDLTNIRRLAAQIKRQAFNDGLTGLFNHGHFYTLLAAQINLQKQKNFSLGLMFVDLDKFKAINDEEGHAAGDAILKTIAQILLSEVRQGNDYVCRYGGDEFAIIVPGITEEGLEAMAGRIVEQVPSACSNKVSASIGLALLKKDENEADILNRADRAVYIVKRSGGNGFTWG